MDYISREKLRHTMYHEAFETDTDLQKWESGCWIRYKLFENVVEALPAADVEEVIRCKDCEHRGAGGFCLVIEGGTTPEGFCHFAKRWTK